MFIYKTLVVLFVILCVHYSRIYYNKKQDYPLILDATSFFGGPLFNQLGSLSKCPFKCHTTNNEMFYPDVDVAIFHLSDMKWKKLYDLKTNPFRLNILFNLEPSTQTKMVNGFPSHFFNATLTFRRDSTIWMPYDQFRQISLNEKNNSTFVWNNRDVEEVLKKKTKLALQIVSHCHTQSQRELFVIELQKYVNITIYGKCNNVSLTDYSAEIKEVQKHFFYLALENSICEDYVTEKFWRIKHLTVPIVLKRSILKGLVEDEYFIAVNDFKSMKDLADHLTHLSKNLNEYKKYLGWVKKYKKTSNYADQQFCKICEMAVKKEKHFINDIYQWWGDKSKCYDKYV